MRFVTATGESIRDWTAWTRPKEAYQWKAGRSAMECARAWWKEGRIYEPAEIRKTLDSHDLTRGVRLTEGIPEHVTPLPEPGEGRNHDLLLVGVVGASAITIGVEAKTDEPFGRTVGEHIAESRRRWTRTRVPRRVQLFSELLRGGPLELPTLWDSLRYQLLMAAAGTVLEAQGRRSQLAVLLIHELRSNLVTEENLHRNAQDFAAFVTAVMGSAHEAPTHGRLYGPIYCSHEQYVRRPIKLLIGKAICEMRSVPTQSPLHES